MGGNDCGLVLQKLLPHFIQQRIPRKDWLQLTAILFTLLACISYIIMSSEIQVSIAKVN